MIKLTQKQKLVLQTTMLRARTPVSDLAKQVGMKGHTVRAALDLLKEKKIFLGVRPFLNLSPLSLTPYMMFVSLVGGTERERAAFEKALCSFGSVVFVAEVGGDYQYELWLYAKDSTEFLNLVDKLRLKFKAKIEVQGISLVHSLFFSGPKYVTSGAPAVKPLSYSPVEKKIEIDEVDHSILFHMGNFNFESTKKLARKLGLPAATVAYRIKNLEKEGVITGYYYVHDFKVFGDAPLSLLIYSNALGKEAREKLIRFCNKHPRINYVNITVGAWAARVFVCAADFMEAKDIMHELYHAFPEDIKAIKIMPQLAMYKCDSYPLTLS